MSEKKLTPAMQADEKLALAIYTLSQKLGDLSSLGTTAKGSLTAALNEVKQAMETAAAGSLDEAAVNRLIAAKLAELTNGASSAADTLKELEDLISSGSTATQAVLQEIAALKSKDTELETALTAPDGWLTKIDNILATGQG